MSWPQCVAWVHAVAPHMARSERSLQRYVELWDVVGKVRRAIAEGQVELGGRMLGAVLNDPDARTPRYGRYGDSYYGDGYTTPET